MISAEATSVISRAKQLYADQLQKDLESQQIDRFVSIEPDSGEYFLGNTFDEAVESARMKYPFAPVDHHDQDRTSCCISHRKGGTVNGFVDGGLRAMVQVPVSASSGGVRTEMLVWIDTAFNGGMAIPRSQIAELGLTEGSFAEAVLADGNTVELETFACFLDWFGKSYKTQIVASEGKYPLLGTMLLDGHSLNIDYKAKTVNLM